MTLQDKRIRPTNPIFYNSPSGFTFPGKIRVMKTLLQLLEDRYGKRSTIITSQFPVCKWHKYKNEPTLADAIMDRLSGSAHRFELKGESLRRKSIEKKQYFYYPCCPLKNWLTLLRNHWHGLHRNHWHGLLRNEWHCLSEILMHFLKIIMELFGERVLSKVNGLLPCGVTKKFTVSQITNQVQNFKRIICFFHLSYGGILNSLHKSILLYINFFNKFKLTIPHI